MLNEFQYFRNSITPFNKFLLENLTVPQLLKNVPFIYGARKFITAFTGTLQLTIQSRSMRCGSLNLQCLIV
jgi:hypothetical protein